MKILDTTLIVDPGIQQPFTGPTLLYVMNAYKEALAALSRVIEPDNTRVTVLYGCVNSTPGTTTYTLSAGAVYYNGEIFLVPAATLTTSGNFVVLNLVDTNTLGNQTFSDGIARQVSHDRTGVWALGATGSGTISGTSASNYDEMDGLWRRVGDTNQPAFQNSWVASSDPPRFKKIGNFVMMDGIITGGSTGTVAFSLPSGYRPISSGDKRFPTVSNTLTDSQSIFISPTTGNVRINFSGSGLIWLDSVRMATD